MITDDADLVARAIIMSGAYEHNWKKHPVLQEAFSTHQNKWPLYNLRMSNLSAAVIRPQLPHLAQRVEDGRRNHDHVAALLAQSPHIHVPSPLAGEERAPDSIQFNLVDLTDDQVAAFVAAAADKGVKVQVFGASSATARAFWSWQFIPDLPELPHTRAMLMRACDVRLPVHLPTHTLEAVADALLEAVAKATEPRAA
mgnify:CR=1 FL=1